MRVVGNVRAKEAERVQKGEREKESGRVQGVKE